MKEFSQRNDRFSTLGEFPENKGVSLEQLKYVVFSS